MSGLGNSASGSAAAARAATAVARELAPRLLAWFDLHGRHDLPWQRERSLYRVWVSEIMLQQTQVSTVIPYFERFVARFPTLVSLAAAPLDAVLSLWAGLGYYARARHLHRAAALIVAQHAGEFPREFAAVAALPGIGRSTAGAILAQALGQRHAILDGNVKRVLARRHGIAGELTTHATVQHLWRLADAQTPHDRLADFTQAIMDLGATCCTRTRPACERCPVAADCVARSTGRQQELPTPKARVAQRKARPQRRTVMLLAQLASGEVLLERRPESGIWGGLWCMPEYESVVAARVDAPRLLGLEIEAPTPLPVVRHSFTHFDLDIEPWLWTVPATASSVADSSRATLWYNAAQPRHAVGLPAPVKSLLEQLAANKRDTST